MTQLVIHLDLDESEAAEAELQRLEQIVDATGTFSRAFTFNGMGTMVWVETELPAEEAIPKLENLCA